MKNKLYWGLAILIILIVGVSVVILTRTTDTEQRTVYNDVDPSKSGHPSTKKLAETDKFTKWFEGNKSTLVSDDSEQVEGDIPDEQDANKFPDWHSLTLEQKKHIYDQFYVQFGLKVPPRGYDYDWKEPGVPYLDENGNPVLRRLDEPLVRIRMGIGFAPTLEEWKRYSKLLDDQGWADARGDVAEVERIQSEIDALEASAQRMRPLSVSASWQNTEARLKARSFSKEKFNAALREHGLAHLISPWD